MWYVRWSAFSPWRALSTFAMICGHFLGISAVLAAAGPSSLVYQARFLNAAGTAPLLDSNLTVTFAIYNPSVNCLLYEETHAAVDSSTSGGYVSLRVGSGTRTGSDPGLSLAALFANAGSQIRAPGAGCAGGYTPSAGDSRKMRVTVTPNAGAPMTLSPDQTFAAQPYAWAAETLQGIGPAGFIQAAGNTSQATVGVLTNEDGGATADASTLHHHDSLYVRANSSSSQTFGSGGFSSSGPATVGSVSIAGQGTLGLGTFTSTQETTLTGSLNATTDVGKTWYNSTTGEIKVWNGATATAVGSTWATSGSNAYRSAGSVGIGTNSPQAKLDVAGGVRIADDTSSCTSTNEGTFRYVTATKKVEVCDGTSWTAVAMAVSGSGNPNAFSFTAVTGATLNTTYVSNAVTMAGFTGSLTGSVTGGGSPQLSVNSGPWVGAASVNPGDSIRLRVISSNAVSTLVTAVLTVGTTSASWQVTTAAGSGSKVFLSAGSYAGSSLNGSYGADLLCMSEAATAGYSGNWKAVISTETLNARDRLSIVYPVLNAFDGTLVESTDFWGSTFEGPIKRRSDGAAYYAFTGTSGNGDLQPGQTCGSWTGGDSTTAATHGYSGWVDQRMMVDSTTACTASRHIYCIEQAAATWSGTPPNAIAFTATNGAPFGGTITSNTVTLGGFTGSLYAEVNSAEAPNVARMSVNGGGWVRSANVTSGDQVQLRMTMSASTSTRVSLLVGPTRGDWDITTANGSVMFITSGTYNAAGIGSLANADSICQTEAALSGLGGTWTALLSDETTDARDRVTFSYPVVNAFDNSIVEATDIWNSSHEGTITYRNSESGTNYVWTGTNDDGTRRAGETCSSWTTTSGNGHFGHSSFLSPTNWIGDNSWACSGVNSIYCVRP